LYSVWFGLAVGARYGRASSGKLWQGKFRQLSYGKLRHGEFWQGTASSGKARHVAAGFGS